MTKPFILPWVLGGVAITGAIYLINKDKIDTALSNLFSGKPLTEAGELSGGGGGGTEGLSKIGGVTSPSAPIGIIPTTPEGASILSQVFPQGLRPLTLEDWKYAKVERNINNPNPPTIQELVGLENLPTDWTTPYIPTFKLSAKQPQNLPETPKTSWEQTIYNLGFRTSAQSQQVSAIPDTTKKSWNVKDTLISAGFLAGSMAPPPFGTALGAEYDVKVSGEPRLIAYPANIAGDILGFGGGALTAPAGLWVSVPVNVAGQIGGTEGAYALLKPFESKAKKIEEAFYKKEKISLGVLTPQKIVSGILSGITKLIPTYPTIQTTQLISKKTQTAITKVQAPNIISQKEVSKAVELQPTSTIQKVTKTPVKTEQIKISPNISVSKGVQVTYGGKMIKKAGK